MRFRQALVIATATLALCACGTLTASAFAAGLAPPVADCYRNGQLTRHYTVKQLENGLATMQAEVAAYSDCHDVLESQLLAELGKGTGGAGGSGGGGGSFLPTWLIVVLAILVVAAGAFGVQAIRQRRAAGGAGDGAGAASDSGAGNGEAG